MITFIAYFKMYRSWGYSIVAALRNAWWKTQGKA